MAYDDYEEELAEERRRLAIALAQQGIDINVPRASRDPSGDPFDEQNSFQGYVPGPEDYGEQASFSQISPMTEYSQYVPMQADRPRDTWDIGEAAQRRVPATPYRDDYGIYRDPATGQPIPPGEQGTPEPDYVIPGQIARAARLGQEPTTGTPGIAGHAARPGTPARYNQRGQLISAGTPGTPGTADTPPRPASPGYGSQPSVGLPVELAPNQMSRLRDNAPMGSSLSETGRYVPPPANQEGVMGAAVGVADILDTLERRLAVQRLTPAEANHMALLQRNMMRADEFRRQGVIDDQTVQEIHGAIRPTLTRYEERVNGLPQTHRQLQDALLREQGQRLATQNAAQTIHDALTHEQRTTVDPHTGAVLFSNGPGHAPTIIRPPREPAPPITISDRLRLRTDAMTALGPEATPQAINDLVRQTIADHMRENADLRNPPAQEAAANVAHVRSVRASLSPLAEGPSGVIGGAMPRVPPQVMEALGRLETAVGRGDAAQADGILRSLPPAIAARFGVPQDEPRPAQAARPLRPFVGPPEPPESHAVKPTADDILAAMANSPRANAPRAVYAEVGAILRRGALSPDDAGRLRALAPQIASVNPDLARMIDLYISR